EAPTMMLSGPVALAESDDDHLGDAALEPAAEIGVRLDARDSQDGVGFESIFIPPDRLVPGVDADLDGGHVGLDRDAEFRLADAVLCEQFALALGSCAAVRSHGGDDERFRSGLQQ